MPSNTTIVKHWLPIITFCPVNKLPDLIYISITFTNEFQELYVVRRKVRELARFKLAYMEDIVDLIQKEYPSATRIELNLLFKRHTVIYNKVRT